MFTQVFLYLANRPAVYHLITKYGIFKGLARRFVAGETLAEGIDAVRELNRRGRLATLNYLGENVSNAPQAATAAAHYIEVLEAIDQAGVTATASVKLTQLGLDIGDEVCLENIRQVVGAAKERGIFVRIDMEASAYTERTIAIFKELHQSYDNVGLVIQAYLYRSEKDLQELIDVGAKVRLCKGAYREPSTVAFPDKKDVDRAYLKLEEMLLAKGNFPAIATHDELMIEHAKEFAARNSVEKSRFEFQMLYGVRRDLQEQLISEGYNVRIYVPFGEEWYPYLTRRLVERPANLLFMVSSLLKEAKGGPG